MVSLETLLQKFQPNGDFTYEGRHFRTHVPPLGPLAYLHILYDAADEEIQRDIIDPLNLPAEVRAFYHRYNGAHLFSDLFSLYGFWPKTYQIDRKNWRASRAYNILDSNKYYFNNLTTAPIFLVGSYGLDRSEVFVERATGLIYCSVGANLNRIRRTWPSFDAWLEQEITRLCEHFDERGNRLVESEETLPSW